MVGGIEMTNFEGMCQHCGNTKLIMAADQEDADLKATHDCDCGGETVLKRKENIVDRLEEIAGERASTYGFQAVDAETLYWLKTAGELVLKGKIDKVNAEVDGTKIIIAEKADGKIKIKRSKTKSTEAEV